jgi:serine protease
MRLNQFYKTIYFFSVICVFFLQQLYGQNLRVIENGNICYLSNKVVIKLKAAPSSGLRKSVTLPNLLLNKLTQFGMLKASITFSDNGSTDNSLSNIVTVDYSSGIDPVIAAAKISKMAGVLWAEPKYVRKIYYVPNDPSYSLQWNLQKVQASSGWDIAQGDTTVIIGIVDSGVDWSHPDLAANMWINYKEIPNNGIDDDHNGYIDDYRGWDFGGLTGTPDNNPIEDRPDHGTHVAGIASAITNNGIGIASIGSKCKLMAVKTSQNNLRDSFGSPYIIYGDEGIKYAVDNGAKVINCSWGGDGFSNAEQELVNYAVSKGVLIVASAGNDNVPTGQYPASYNGVFSVAATDQNDDKSTYSDYGFSVDVCAPGDGIYSTWMPDTYTYLSGTSMAAPLVSGLAGVVKSHFPNLTPIQVGEQIRVNCDNIDNKNPVYVMQLGGGRINADKALANTNSESVRAYNYVFSDNTPGGNNDGVFSPGEEIQVDIKFRNILSPSSNLVINLQSLSGFVSIENPVFNVGALNSLDSTFSSFKFTLSQSVPYNQQINFILNFSDGNYSDFQGFSVIVNPIYLNQAGNNVAMTITSKGNLAFADYPNNLQGQGFKFNDGSNLMFEGALMYGTSIKLVDDVARISGTQSNDFSIVRPFTLKSPGAVADLEGETVFSDSLSLLSLGIKTRLQTYSFASAPDDKFIILKYTFTNTKGVNLSNFFAGLFIDWDMVEGDGTNDIADYDDANNFGYVYHIGGAPSTYVGCGLISSQNYGYYAIQNDGNDGGVGIYDIFTKDEKWQTLSGGIRKKNAGPQDVSMVVSSGPYTINAGSSIDIAFVVAAGDSLADLQNSVIASKTKYSNVLTGVENQTTEKPLEFKLDQNYPNPFNPSTTISYQIPSASYVTLKVYDILGKEVATLVNRQENMGEHSVIFNAKNLTSGIYFYKLQAGNYIATKKLVLLK